eukprot:Rmarinus@m.26489
MSAGYASRLRQDVHYGICGLPEMKDSPRVFDRKIKQLSTYIQNSKHIVFFTGAGVSTAAGIRDFRGPNGVWTVEQARKQKMRGENRRTKKRRTGTCGSGQIQKMQKPLTRCAVCQWERSQLESAMPTLTHLIIAWFLHSEIADFLVSQNVDGLHLRTGIPKSKFAELHGNVFLEQCPKCGFEWMSDCDIGGVGFRSTNRFCPNCPASRLVDSVLDWDDELPQQELNNAQHMLQREGVLVICLGTSLRIEPAGSMPFLVQDKGGRVVLINLQQTAYDSDADLCIRAECDEVLKAILPSTLPLLTPLSCSGTPNTLSSSRTEDGILLNFQRSFSAIVKVGIAMCISELCWNCERLENVGISPVRPVDNISDLAESPFIDPPPYVFLRIRGVDNRACPMLSGVRARWSSGELALEDVVYDASARSPFIMAFSVSKLRKMFKEKNPKKFEDSNTSTCISKRLQLSLQILPVTDMGTFNNCSCVPEDVSIRSSCDVACFERTSAEPSLQLSSNGKAHWDCVFEWKWEDVENVLRENREEWGLGSVSMTMTYNRFCSVPFVQ